jgi:hypothetical protein
MFKKLDIDNDFSTNRFTFNIIEFEPDLFVLTTNNSMILLYSNITKTLTS